MEDVPGAEKINRDIYWCMNLQLPLVHVLGLGEPSRLVKLLVIFILRAGRQLVLVIRNFQA